MFIVPLYFCLKYCRIEFKKLPSVKVNINNMYELRNKHVVMYDNTF